MKKKYLVIITTLTLVISILVSFLIKYMIFDESLDTSSQVLVEEGLSISFTDGKRVKSKEETKIVTFSVTNNTANNLYYHFLIKKIKGDSDLTYKIESDPKEIVNKENSFETITILQKKRIPSNTTHRFTITINNPNKKDYEVTLDVAKDEVDNSFKDIIVRNNNVLDKLGDNKEGLISLGDTYYFKGNVENNYVSINNLIFRILRVNEDGTTTIVLNDIGLTSEIKEANINDDDTIILTPDFLSTKAYQNLENWYKDNLNKYNDYIAQVKYCFDNSVIKQDGRIVLNSINRYNSHEGSLTCQGELSSSKISTLTLDDELLSRNNNDSFLNLDNKTYFLMTPSSKQGDVYSYFYKENNELKQDKVESDKLGIRPVISLTKKTKVTGTGTIDNPYKIDVK